MRPDTTIHAADKSKQEPTEKSLHDLQESGSDFGNFFPKHHVLLAFEQELARAANGDALIAAMNKRYPDAGLAAALQIGAKVAMGEMKWG